MNSNNADKIALREQMLQKRENTSFDLIKISSKQIHNHLKNISQFRDAQDIACYYPTRNEVLTMDIIQEAFSNGKKIYLPKIQNDTLDFKEVTDMDSLEMGRWDISEPREDCPSFKKLDIILVPMVGATVDGSRLGYGNGFYDKFLAKNNIPAIGLTYAKLLVKSIPTQDTDVKMNWIVTEDKVIKIS